MVNTLLPVCAAYSSLESGKYMALAMRQVKVYLKLGVMIAVIAVVLLLVLMNRNHTTDVWFFATYEDVNILWLMLITAVSAVICWWGARKIFRVLHELKEVRQAAILDQQMQEQRRVSQELAEREKRIDEKIRHSITEES